MWLLVEDDADIRNVVAMMMIVWGEQPLAFPDGRTTWSWLDTVEDGTFTGTLPELALMDIRMPGYTGDQLAARIRSIEALKDIPIVLMTAFSMTEAEVKALQTRCGFDHLIIKPLPDMDEFRSLLYQVRDRRRARPAEIPGAPTPSEASSAADMAVDATAVAPSMPDETRTSPSAEGG